MALFLDGPPSTIDDLNLQDSFLLATATTEGIDVSNKLQGASVEMCVELTAVFARGSSIYAPVLGQAPLDLRHLAVTPALKLWHTFKSLELVYRDAYFNQLNDRYAGKRAEYQSLAAIARERFIDTGAGIVVHPLPQPSAPVSSLQPASQTGGSVYLTVTFVNSAGEESSPAIVSQYTVPDGSVLVVSNPIAPTNATGWNVYGGMTPTSLTLQTTNPQSLGAPWTLIFPGSSTGLPAGTGQSPNVIRDIPRRLMRG